MTTKEYADSLRMVADWYEAHPEVPVPHTHTMENYSVNDRETMVAVVKALGTCEKEYSDTMFHARKTFGVLTVDFMDYRERVCIRRVVGTETKVVKKPVEPITFVEEEVTTEVVEWDCEPLLAPVEG